MEKIRKLLLNFVVVEIIIFLEILFYYFFTKTPNVNVNMFYWFFIVSVFFHISKINVLFSILFLFINTYISKVLLWFFVFISICLLVFFMIEKDLFLNYSVSTDYLKTHKKFNLNIYIRDNYYRILIILFLLLNHFFIGLLAIYNIWKFKNDK